MDEVKYDPPTAILIDALCAYWAARFSCLIIIIFARLFFISSNVAKHTSHVNLEHILRRHKLKIFHNSKNSFIIIIIHVEIYI